MGKSRKRCLPLEDEICAFCKRDFYSDPDSVFILGEPRKLGSISFHHHCLLLSPNLFQKGDETEGVDGFLLPDILAEIRRGQKLRCTYCRAPGATIGCEVKTCKKLFHLACGIEAGVQTCFTGSYPSYCIKHRVKQELVPFEKEFVTCVYCAEVIDSPEPSATVVVTPCCRRSFHLFCLRKAAAIAGEHHFACAHCRNQQEFQQELRQHGVFIPDRDAKWETDTGAFQSLYEQYKHCDAPKCLCPRGRDADIRDDDKWELTRCDHCGSSATHIRCSSLKNAASFWLCATCDAVQHQSSNRSRMEVAQSSSQTSSSQTSSSSSSNDTSVGNFKAKTISSTIVFYRLTSFHRNHLTEDLCRLQDSEDVCFSPKKSLEVENDKHNENQLSPKYPGSGETTVIPNPSKPKLQVTLSALWSNMQ